MFHRHKLIMPHSSLLSRAALLWLLNILWPECSTAEVEKWEEAAVIRRACIFRRGLQIVLYLCVFTFISDSSQVRMGEKIFIHALSH